LVFSRNDFDGEAVHQLWNNQDKKNKIMEKRRKSGFTLNLDRSQDMIINSEI
jgi:hypothetical protein